METMELKNGNATYRITFLELMNGCRIADNCPNYRKVKFVKLDEADKVITDRMLYFRSDDGFVVPKFETYEEVRRFWSYPNGAKLDVKTKVVYDVKEV